MLILFTLLFAALQAEEAPRDTFRYGSVSENILAGGWFHEHEMNDPAFMKSLMAKARVPEVQVGGDTDHFTPVIFIPGMTGAILEAKLEDKKEKVSFLCWSNSDWYMVYGGVDVTNPDVLKIMAPGIYECTFDNLRLKYEAATGKHIGIQGVITRVKGEHLDSTGFDPSDDPITQAFGDFDADLHWGQPSWGLDMFLQMIGYTSYANLWHAPYDFRKSSVDFVEKDYPRLKALTEHVYAINGNKKVAFIGVSMGGPYLSSFMLYLDQFPGWKEQYVDSMFTFAGVFGGAIYNLGTLIFGETYGIPYIEAEVFQRMYKTWGCGTWLTPMEGNEDNKVIVRVKELDGTTTEYRVNDMQAFFESVPDLANSGLMKKDYFNENAGNEVHQAYHDPGVKTHCFFNADTPTYGTIDLDRSDVQKFDADKNAAMTAHGEFTGDGVSNYEELAVCRDWANTRVWETNGQPHASEMGSWDHMQYVAAHLTGEGDNPQSCTETHTMETECGDDEEPSCPTDWIPAGDPTSDGCPEKTSWCWGDGCKRYKIACFRQDWWVCKTGQKCGQKNQQCFDERDPLDDVETISSGSCASSTVMSPGECEAYANLVGKKFELRSKDHEVGCYERTVHGTDFVLYQTGEPKPTVEDGAATPCTTDQPCVCFRGGDDDADLSESELAEPKPRDTFRYGSVSKDILAAGWFHENEMYDPEFMKSLMAKAKIPEVEVGSDTANFDPVIFVPGMTGAVIEAKVEDKQDKVSIMCWSNADWYMVFGGVDVSDPDIIKILGPGVYKCTFDNLRLKYEDTTGRHVPIQGVITRVKGEHLDADGFNPETDDPITRAFGDFDADLHWGGAYTLSAYLQNDIGYTKYANLWHAPYDFRKSSVDFVEKEYPRLKALTEHVYATNGNKKVSYITVSMGGPYLSSFMMYLDQFPGWKEKHVKEMFTFAGVFGGAIYNLGTLIFGETYGIPFIKAEDFQRMYKSWGCGTWLTPMVGNEDNKVVVKVQELDGSTTEYRVNDMQAFFESVPDLADSGLMKKDYFNENAGNRVHQPYHDPGVKTHCFFNADTPTYGVIELDRSDVQKFDTEKNAAMTAHGEFTGDGVANYEELAVCRDWADTRVWETNGWPHAGEMSDIEHFHFVVAKLIGNGENPVECTETHIMETDCGSDEDPSCPDGWYPTGGVSDDCQKKTGWCWGDGCKRYKRECIRWDVWACDDGQKCDYLNQKCFDNKVPTDDNVHVGMCSGKEIMSEGECEAYANLVGKKFELRSKDHDVGCYEKTVHGIDFVLYQKGKPRPDGQPKPCSDDEPCVCWEGDDGAILAEQELSAPQVEAEMDGSLPDSFTRYLVLFGAGALLGAWHFTRAKKDDERLPLLEYV